MRRAYPLSALCAALRVSLSGYRAWKRGDAPDRTRLTDAPAVTPMQGPDRVERLMREHGIVRRFKATTDSRHVPPLHARLPLARSVPRALDQRA